MRFTALIIFAAAFVASACSAPSKRDVNPALIPQFGLASGINPTGTGDCDGIDGPNGQPIKIPCSCPPDRNTFIQDLNANIAAGHAVHNPSVAVTFPTGSDANSQSARIEASIITLQNLNGPGVGCPASSTTFVAQQAAIQAGASAPAVTTVQAAPTQAASAQAAQTSAAPTGGVNPALVPQFGLAAGLNPTGTGNCDGIPGQNGKPIEIPCSCPPDRDTFIQSLSANVAAGHAIHNPSVAVTFPPGSDNASQAARIEASIITLQNLNGPGVGCPAASTTFVAQQQALQRRSRRRTSW